MSEIEQIKKENNELLENFKKWLQETGLSEKTINSHVNNAKFFINEFLVYEEAIPASEGGLHISMFLGYWFIKKAMWASPAEIKANAASLKKFYTFLQKSGTIEEKELEDITKTIKEEMPDWIATIKRYDDPDITEMEEVWDL